MAHLLRSIGAPADDRTQPGRLQWVGMNGKRVALTGSDGFQDGIPGLCDECFRESPGAERYYCPHNRRLPVVTEGCWETFWDVGPDAVED